MHGAIHRRRQQNGIIVHTEQPSDVAPVATPIGHSYLSPSHHVVAILHFADAAVSAIVPHANGVVTSTAEDQRTIR